MIRRLTLALAVAALAFSVDAALAGGGGGGGKSNTQSVRIKNIGAQPVLVNAKNGSTVGAAGAKTVSQNGVAQFRLKKVASTAWAADVAQTFEGTLPYSFPRSQVVYLEAFADGTGATVTFAPPGKLF